MQKQTFGRWALALGLTLGAGTAPAAQTLWQGPPGGSWHAAAHWTAGMPHAQLDALAARGSIVVQGLDAQAALLTLGGGSGNTAALGLSRARLDVTSLVLGRDPGSVGLISVGSGGHLAAFGYPPIVIGRQGQGVLSVSVGGQLAIVGALVLGELPGSSGSLLVHGGWVSANHGMPLDVAAQGAARLEVLGGGWVNARPSQMTLGRDGGRADVLVSGPGSLLTLNELKALGGATVEVRQGGQIVAEQLHLGAASWTVGAGGLLSPTIRAQMAPDSVLRFELAADGAHGRLTSYDIRLGGRLEVLADPGFVARAGASFQLLSANLFSGNFAQFVLPALPADLRWDSSALASTGRLAVAAVPEPGAAALMALGLLFTLRRARQRR